MMRVSMSYDNLSVVMSNSVYTHSCLRVLRVRVRVDGHGLSLCVFLWLERSDVGFCLSVSLSLCLLWLGHASCICPRLLVVGACQLSMP